MTERREFLARIAASGVVLAATAADPFIAAAQAVATPTTTGGTPIVTGGTPILQAQAMVWDDTWATTLAAGKYRAVIDGPEMGEGDFLWQAHAFIKGCTQALGAAESEVAVAVVIRHAAIAAAYNDTIWSKYELGKRLKVKDPVTDKKAIRNPFLMVPEGETKFDWLKPITIMGLGARGVTFPCCNQATHFLANQIAKWSHQESSATYEELKANLVPGARLQPTGLYATMRAQQTGAAFMRP